ncbi:hypothetical protein SAMN04489724_1621 [Algoriphagus locisalis]|uniref:Uncharacterized protein n=1 Tax=Algoriphagus locisalis TaxID=305507 RepID=A0A1I7A1V6_9BACT|nr:hypothetical protein SAMN04489724_1621 [Algoriphagus locisalis]
MKSGNVDVQDFWVINMCSDISLSFSDARAAAIIRDED